MWNKSGTAMGDFTHVVTLACSQVKVARECLSMAQSGAQLP